MVTAYTLQGQTLEQIGVSPTMNAASAMLPQGAYTTFRTYHGNRVLRLAQHFRRLEESAALLKMTGSLNDSHARSALAECLRRTGYSETRFRLTFVPPTLYIAAEQFTPYPRTMGEAGVWCVSVTTHRNNPHAKSTSFIASAGDAYRALPQGAHEGLMVAEDGALLEGLSSNFFAVLEGVLHTEQSRALVGVTQTLVLEVASSVRPDVSQSRQAVMVGDLSRISECFITSVSREVMPVMKIDNQLIGAGSPGPVTRSLIAGLHELIEREAERVDTP
jgi:branched-chain amino acid aminotransferase